MGEARPQPREKTETLGRIKIVGVESRSGEKCSVFSLGDGSPSEISPPKRCAVWRAFLARDDLKPILLQ